MIKIRSIKNVTRMSDLKSTNPKDREILSKKIFGLKFSWLSIIRLNFKLANEMVSKMIDPQEIFERHSIKKIYITVFSKMLKYARRESERIALATV